MDLEQRITALEADMEYTRASLQTLWNTLAASGALDVPLAIKLIDRLILEYETGELAAEKHHETVRSTLDLLARELLVFSKRRVRGPKTAPEPTSSKKKRAT